MPDHTHLKWQYQSEVTFDIYLQTKNQLYPSSFPWDIAEILQTCYTWNLWLQTPIFICMPEKTLSFTSFFRYYILKTPALWLVNSILAHNWRTRVLPDMELVGEISITILVFNLDHFQEKWQSFSKNKKKTILGPFLAKFGQTQIFLENMALSIFKYSKYLWAHIIWCPNFDLLTKNKNNAKPEIDL